MKIQGYITPQEFADRVGLAVSSVYTYISRGKLKSTKLANRKGSLIRESEVEKWMPRLQVESEVA